MVDPLHEIDRITDVVVANGLIESVGDCSDPGVRVIDVTGKLVTPGLIDLHAHIFHGVSAYGIHPDRAGVAMGCTHVNDTGSVGWITFSAFKTLIVDQAQTNITCAPNMLSMGMPDNYGFGAFELVDEKYYPQNLIEHAHKYPEILRGVKLFVERGFLSHLKETWKAFEAGRTVCNATGVYMYCHLGDLFPKGASATLLDLPKMIIETVDRMQPGDVLGHCFTQHPGGLVDQAGHVSPAAKLATDKGILHEIGHGVNFSFARAQRFFETGNRVDIISSDLHGFMHAGKARPEIGLDNDIEARKLDYSMVSTMSKCLALGMPLVDVIRASTLTPAKALKLDGQKGSLSPGFRAEISILDLVPGRFTLVDSIDDRLAANHVFVPVNTIIGKRMWQCIPFLLPEILNDYVRYNPGAFDHKVRAANDYARSMSTSSPSTFTS